jgi:cytochrome c-type biogenesis protein
MGVSSVAEHRGGGAPEARPGASRYALLVAALALLALVGYLGYELYPRFDLPAADGAALLVLAAAAGVASFFSPCAFPLLVTVLARETSGTGAKSEAEHRPLTRALLFAGALSLGAAVFLLLSGAAVALGAGALFESVTFTSVTGRIIRATVGGLLLLFGAIQMGLLHNPLAHGAGKGLMRAQARLRREHPVLGFGLLGFAYLIAGFG